MTDDRSPKHHTHAVGQSEHIQIYGDQLGSLEMRNDDVESM